MYLFSPLKPILFRRSRYQCSSRDSRIKWSDKRKKKKYLRLSIHFCQFIIWRGGGRRQPPLSLSSISIFILSFSECYRSSHTSKPRSFQFSFPPPPSPPDGKMLASFLYIFSPFSPLPLSFFLFISFHLVHRAISEIDFSYPVRRRRRVVDRLCTRI